jgi:murein L,D-transpeptidase YafK
MLFGACVKKKRFRIRRVPFCSAPSQQEARLELWALDNTGDSYTLVHTYAICATSGVLGPKRKFGDVQVPEGFYELDWFNPQSNFFLSLHISYPNSADRILGSHANPGGDIFLHGNCVTIGCMPITDEGIKEVYWLAVEVHAAGQRHIPIEIFPRELTEVGIQIACKKSSEPAGIARVLEQSPRRL